MAEVGGHLVQPPLLNQGHLDSVAQDYIQKAFDLQGRRLHKLSGQPVSVLGLSHSKEVFPFVHLIPYVQVLPKEGE